MICKSTAVFAVADVQQTVSFYVNVLGFRQHWLWGNPPTFGCVGHGQVELFLSQELALSQRVEGHGHYFFVEDIDSLYEQHRSAAAPMVAPLETKPWGMREYIVRDPNGYHLRFGASGTYQAPKIRREWHPPHVRLDVGLPDLATFVSLYESVDWAADEPSMQQALERSLFGVLAIDTREDGRAVGMARLTGDGRSFVIWDVIVRPSHQGQKIGRGLVDATVAELRRRGLPKGAFLGLFTGKPGFYEKLGFRSGVGMFITI
jgi:catechol 2,3-dioxygenase-like lactoylglutathione lyase family enzyme